ncbi:MAG TPA: TIGR03790 family protein [Verrucomicrobiae bacterium]|nr:TIGR03790 family protein [Verrucomicrobiae bacterium]
MASVCVRSPGRILRGFLVAVIAHLALNVHAGGSGLNTIVVANQASSNSCILANYYCQQRQVPPQNLLYVNWQGGNTLWTSNDLQTNLVSPMLNMLAARQLTNQVSYIVLSMDIPFQTSDGSTIDGTTSALFYGLRLGNGTDPLGFTNSYAASEGIFNQDAPLVGAPGYSFLTTMITADSLAQAEQLINQGVAADGTFPQFPVVLDKSSDTARNIRYLSFDNAIFNVNLLGVSSVLQTNTDSIDWPAGCMGYETGTADFSVPAGIFSPGAIADSLTSFGGIIFGSNDQTNELAFIDAGASGSYGTVSEPENDTQKFPNPQVYFYQARGFSLAESYYQSINAPFLGLIVGEPLSAPFARSGYGQWGTNVPNAVLSGTTNLAVTFNAHDRNRPLEQVDLFVDGVYNTTIINVPPTPGNLLTANLNGYPISYNVPTNATLATVANGLVAEINAATNATLITATAFGDRIQLQSIAMNSAAAPFYVTASTPTGTPGVTYSVNYLPDTFPPQMTAGAVNRSGAYTMKVGIPDDLPYVMLASTNLLTWQPIFTNDTPGLLNFTDWDSTNYPARYYRMSWPAPQVPQVSAPKVLAGAFQMLVTEPDSEPWEVQTSTDLVNWNSIFTNLAGGTISFTDTSAASLPGRFYRTAVVTPPAPALSVVNTLTNLTLVRISNATLPYTVGISTNSGQWIPLATNFAIGQIQTSASSAVGVGSGLSTYLTAAQPQLMPSQALGMQSYTVISNIPPTNGWMQFTFTKTNGQVVAIAITNQAAQNSVALANEMINAINSNSALEGGDGVQAQDFVAIPGMVSFNIYARSPGLAPAQLQVLSQAANKIYMTTGKSTLTANLSNLEPRNHLYVTAGASRLALTFPFVTTNFADGYHQLTAVAYEGSSIRTETQTTVSIQIQNSSLDATITLLNVTNSTVPLGGSFQVQVNANTNNVSLVTLYSNGGPFAAVTNQSTATFQIAGTNFWNGQIPFYAIVQTSSGLQYRTQVQWVTITP